MKVYIVVSTFYHDLSDQLIKGASDAIHGNEINVIKVPGAFEIPGTVKQILENKNPDLIITLGVIVKGETNHFEQISDFVFQSISNFNISYNIPISFGVISALSYKQAEERALISKRNKGAEVAATGLKMQKLYEKFKK